MNSERTKIEDIIKSFVHFSLPPDLANLPENSLEFVIKLAFYRANKQLTEETLKSFIEKELQLKFEPEEIYRAVEILEKSGALFKSGVDYRLVASEVNKLKKLEQNLLQEEQQIFQDWATELTKNYPELTPEDLACFIEDIKTYYRFLYLRHGAECASLIYPEIAITNPEFLKGVDLFLKLPPREKNIDDIRRREFPKFFLEATAERQKLLLDELNASFFYRILTIDPKCSQFLQKSKFFRNYEVFIDTNVLYGLVGLDGQEQESAIKRIFDILKQLGFKIFITRITINEFNNSLDRARRFLEHHSSVPSQSILNITKNNIETNFVTQFWHQYREFNISKEEFFARYSHIQDLLKPYNIQITDRFGEEAKQERSRIRHLLELLMQTKNYHVAIHDAFHISYVHTLLEKRAEESSVRFWFLTEDHFLPIYERKVFRSRGEPFLVIMPHQLMQIIRWFVPRVDDFEDAFIKLLSIPLMRGQQLIPANAANIMLAKLSQYKNLTPEIAGRMVTDARIVAKIRRVRTDDDKELEQIIELEALKTLEQQLAEKKKISQQLSKKASETTRLQKEIDSLKRTKEEMEQKAIYHEKKSKFLGYILAAVLFIVLFYPVWLFARFLRREFNFSGFTGLLVTVILYIVLGIITFSIPYGWEWGRQKLINLSKKIWK